MTRETRRLNYGTRAERLWKRVDRSAGPDACWPWTGSVNPKGYGDLGPGPGERTAHRIAYASTFGAIPPGLCVLHRCDNPPCCNPAQYGPVLLDDAGGVTLLGRAA